MTLDMEGLLATYPRQRPALPDAYRRIYEREYQLNRSGKTIATKLALGVETWMHRIVAKRATPGTLLEIGAGTLNHLAYETTATAYDVIEPFEALYRNSPDLKRLRQVYRQIDEIPESCRYDRVISIAVLEHLEDLPTVIARSALLLSEGGIEQHGIPSEGGALWGIGWRLTTGVAYRLRNKLSYAVAMRHEHINNASEIVSLMRWFFERVESQCFPLPFRHGSLYTYIEAKAPRRDRCRAHLQRRLPSLARADAVAHPRDLG